MYLWELYEGKDYHIIPTLERIQRAVSHVGLSKPSFTALQVGGTNGKGSTCAFLESLLRHHGYKTGWFVSPHLVNETERWRVNRKKMDEETLRLYVEELKPVFEKFELTYFEACTLIAMKHFEDQGVDFAVFEVGMGGRWDATRVCNPIACGITNIGRDHVKWLGRDPEVRALEKLGIYVEGRPLVLGSPRYPLYPKSLEVCRAQDLIVAGIDFTAYGRIVSADTVLEHFNYGETTYTHIPLSLWGKWQVDNASMALVLAMQVIKLEEEKVRKALSQTVWEGRFEIIRKKPLLILDGAHNIEGIKNLVKLLKRHFPNVKPVFTGLKDKDWRTGMELLRELSQKIYLVRIEHHRGEELQSLVDWAQRLGFDVKTLERAEEVLSLEEDVIVLGSLYLVGEVKRVLSLIKG